MVYLDNLAPGHRHAGSRQQEQTATPKSSSTGLSQNGYIRYQKSWCFSCKGLISQKQYYICFANKPASVLIKKNLIKKITFGGLPLGVIGFTKLMIFGLLICFQSFEKQFVKNRILHTNDYIRSSCQLSTTFWQGVKNKKLKMYQFFPKKSLHDKGSY